MRALNSYSFLSTKRVKVIIITRWDGGCNYGIEFREHENRALEGKTTLEKIRNIAGVGSYSREAG